MKCDDCGSENLHFLVWADKNNKIVDESLMNPETGEYWCEDCKELKY